MTEHAKLMEALRLVEQGQVKASMDRHLIMRLHGCGKTGPRIWAAYKLKLVTIVTRRGERVPVALTDAGRARLGSAKEAN